MNNNRIDDNDLEVSELRHHTNEYFNDALLHTDTIESGMFYNEDGITEIVIPENIKEIQSDAFICCPNLRRIIFVLPPNNRYKSFIIAEEAFDNFDNLTFMIPLKNCADGGNACIEDYARRHNITVEG